MGTLGAVTQVVAMRSSQCTYGWLCRCLHGGRCSYVDIRRLNVTLIDFSLTASLLESRLTAHALQMFPKGLFS